MDKRVILAVAGSGKTTFIVNRLSLDKRCLIITYTINNTENLRHSIIEKFGFLPNNIKLVSYFSFLYSFCFRPFLSSEISNKGIYWKYPPDFSRNFKRDDISYYITNSRKLYHNRLAKLIQAYELGKNIKARLEKYFDSIYIDEVQDFAGHDFELLKTISKSDLEMLFVGDFYQHTFDTSSDGRTNINLHDDYDKYKQKFSNMGLKIDIETLKNSYRCSKTTCDYIRDKIGIDIFSHGDKETQISFIQTQEEAQAIFDNQEIVKLFYQKYYEYPCFGNNWGNCKGENKYNDVCIVLNPTTIKNLKGDKFDNLVPQTRNKLYVACSRARGNIYFVSEAFYKAQKIKKA